MAIARRIMEYALGSQNPDAGFTYRIGGDAAMAPFTNRTFEDPYIPSGKYTSIESVWLQFVNNSESAFSGHAAGIVVKLRNQNWHDMGSTVGLDQDALHKKDTGLLLFSTDNMRRFLESGFDRFYIAVQGDIDDGGITVRRDTKLRIVVDYTYKDSSLTAPDNFKCYPVADNKSRKVHFEWKTQGHTAGHKTPANAVVKYTLYDTSAGTHQQMYTKSTNNVGETISVNLEPLIYNSARSYTVVAIYDGIERRVGPLATVMPGPSVHKAPQVLLELPDADEEDFGEDFVETLISNKVLVKWSNPEIYHAENLHVNFEIVVSKSFQITAYTNNTALKAYYSSANSPVIVGTTPNISSGNQDYPYQFELTKEILNQFAENYDKIYIAVRPVIRQDDNPTKTAWNKTLTEANSLMYPKIEEFTWAPFIFMYECTIRYCPDGIRWVPCNVYYCPDGEHWTPVIVRWTNDGTKWSVC